MAKLTPEEQESKDEVYTGIFLALGFISLSLAFGFLCGVAYGLLAFSVICLLFGSLGLKLLQKTRKAKTNDGYRSSPDLADKP